MDRITQYYGPMTPAYVKEKYEIDCLSNCGIHVDRLCEYENLMDDYNIPDIESLEKIIATPERIEKVRKQKLINLYSKGDIFTISEYPQYVFCVSMGVLYVKLETQNDAEFWNLNTEFEKPCWWPTFGEPHNLNIENVDLSLANFVNN